MSQRTKLLKRKILSKFDCLSLIVYQFLIQICKLSFAITIAIYLAFSVPMETDAARYFNKFWNFSLVFPNPYVTNVNSVTMVMPTRAQCVSLCGMNVSCCCTQWVPSNNTCTILMADRAGLSPHPLAVSSIESANKLQYTVLKILINNTVFDYSVLTLCLFPLTGKFLYCDQHPRRSHLW